MSLGFFEAVTAGLSRLTTRRCPSASLRLRANPVGLRPPWALPFAPVHPRGGGVRALRLFPPIRDTNRPAMPSLVCIPHFGPSSLLTTASHFFIVMLRLPPLTPGFPPTRNSHCGLCPPVMAIPRSSPTGLLRGLRTSSLSRLACSRRPASLRLRANPVGLRPPWVLPFAPVHPGCSQRLGRF